MTRLQGIGKGAAKMQQALDKAPEQAARLRNVVQLTTEQLTRLRLDVQSSLSGIRAADEGRQLQALREIHGAQPTLREAGFELAGVDMELEVSGQTILRLVRVAEVDAARLKGMADVNRARPSLHALLLALARAQEAAEGVDLEGLVYSGATVWLGPSPKARITWRSETEEVEEEIEEAPFVAGPIAGSPPAAQAKPGFGSGYGKGGFFGERSAMMSPAPMPATGAEKAESREDEPANEPAAPAAEQAAGKDWRTGVLDRFKKMPDLGKR
jgi:hypothetical protein